jgi:uncharacterized protein YybS (DUF2232 family)
MAVGINLLLILLLAGGYSVTKGVNPHTLILKGIQASIAQTGVLYEKAGVTGDDLKNLQQGMVQAGDLISRVYPALIIITIALIAGLNLALLRKNFKRLPDHPILGDFIWYRNPEHLVWFLIAAGFAMLLSDRQVTTAALNILVITISLYFVQGMAIVTHFFTRLTVPRVARGFFYIVLMLQPFLAGAIAALGIFDIWGDFRTPKQQENL